MHPLTPSLLRTRAGWIVAKARWLIALALTLIGAIGAFLGVPDLNRQLRTDLPGLHCWAPVPMDDAKFTIAMAPFVTVGENGRARITRDGRELARLLYTRLEGSFAELNLTLPYELRSPDQTCPIQVGERAERAAAAETWAAKLNADVLIYGALVQDGDNTELQPEFFVAYRGFTEAAELTGPFELGRPLRVSLPVASADLEGIEEHPVNARAKALSLIALGLAAYAVDDYEQALTYFESAEQLPNWPAGAGKELVYLLLGNTSSALAGATLDDIYVDEALDYYDQALEIAPDFARALTGRATATYQLALGDLESRRSSQVDTALLDEAEALFRTAATTPAPDAAEIGPKVHFGLGQIFLVRHYLQRPPTDAGPWQEQARREFQAIVDLHSDGGLRNTLLAGHAFARLALITAQLDQNPQAAIPLYQSAIDHVSPRWQAQYAIDLGDLYAATGDSTAARAQFEDALAVAELYGNAAMVARAEERLADLP